MAYQAIRRNHTGHRMGERHHRAKHADGTVQQARQMRAQGLSYGQIALRLDVSVWTVRDWCVYTTRSDCGQG